jgi:hypothetical protein
MLTRVSHFTRIFSLAGVLAAALASTLAAQNTAAPALRSQQVASVADDLAGAVASCSR